MVKKKTRTRGKQGGVPAAPNRPAQSQRFAQTPLQRSAVAGVLLLSFILNSIGLFWGVTGFVSWQPDSIEGAVAAHELPKTFKQWTHKYPRGHFLVNGLLYYPCIQYWESHPVQGMDSQGKTGPAVFTVDRLKTLAMMSRWISVGMSVAGVFGVMLIAFSLFGDFLSAILSGLALSLCYLYVFFSHVGNVDIPYVFWFIWASYFGLKAVQKSSCRCFLLLGFCAAMLVCTKEGASMYLPGLGIGLWVIHSVQAKQNGIPLTRAVVSFWNWKVFFAILIFAAVFLVLNGFLDGPNEFMTRVHSWKTVTDDFLKTFHGQWNLLWTSIRFLYYGLGWPFLLIAVVSLFYFAKTGYKVPLFFAIAPIVLYYLITIMNIHFVAPRFLMGGYPGLCLLVGKTTADWLNRGKIPRFLRYCPVILIYGLSLLYCLGLDMELCDDTRERTEQWIRQNLPKDQPVVSACQKNYAPRLHFQGYRHFPNWSSSLIEESNRHNPRFYPEYVLYSYDGTVKVPNDEEFQADLMKQKHYQLVQRYRSKYLYPAKTVFAVAGWSVRNGWLSPDMFIYKKRPLTTND
ncbi:MAG: glycosyltransferase family 39 protein [Planctomycetales bacterium]|nr:glycosyltransferase family 39 protein [Planctomycetales bacterium]